MALSMKDNYAGAKEHLVQVLGDNFDGEYFDKKWKDVSNETLGLCNACCIVQNFVNKSGDAKRYKKNPSSFDDPPPEMTWKDVMDFNVYMGRYIELGGDPDYFQSGSGAYGNCVIS